MKHSCATYLQGWSPGRLSLTSRTKKLWPWVGLDLEKVWPWFWLEDLWP